MPSTSAVRTTLLLLAAAAAATADDICECLTCCNVDSTSLDFTGRNMVPLTFPLVSLEGTYSIVEHRTAGGDSTYNYDLVLKYLDDNKAAFDRNLMVFSDSPLDCTDSHIFVGSPEDATSKRFPLVAHATENYCHYDVQGVLSREEIAVNTEVYLAFNALVPDGKDFQIMVDGTEDGLIVPEDDILYYPYVIKEDSVTAQDVNDASEFYIDVGLQGQDVSAVSGNSNDGLTCLTMDQLLAEGYWEATSNCLVTLTGTGTGDELDGRQYNIKLQQSQYETCSFSAVQSVDDNLEFTFRLVLPRDGSETTDAGDDDDCRYFAENRNVQNVVVRMERDVSEIMDDIFVHNFNARLAGVEPERCAVEDYPTPHSFIHVVFDVTMPGDFDSSFSSVTLPDFDGIALTWDTPTGNRPAEIECEDGITSPPEEATRVCHFYFRSTSCEPTFATTEGRCAFEVNTNRLFTGFAVTELWPSSQTATYVADPVNSDLDHSTFDIELCEPASEAAAVEVTDSFNVELDVQNYYTGEIVAWGSQDAYSMNSDMIVRLKVGQTAASPFTFSGDLDLQIATVTVTLTNPVTDAIITSQTFSVSDKEKFMDSSWTPYYNDPRFCSYHDDAVASKCGPFFVDQVRSNNFHDATWITDTMPAECQSGDDSNNADHMLFNPREWFSNNANGYVSMSVSATAIIQKCSDNGGRRLQENVEVLFVRSSKVVSFLQTVSDPVSGDEEGGLAGITSDTTMILACVCVVLFVMGCGYFCGRACSDGDRDRRETCRVRITNGAGWNPLSTGRGMAGKYHA